MSRALAGRRGAVVAGGATAGHLRVVDAQRRLPRRCAMPGFATGRRQDVTRALAGRARSVMTAHASARDAGMVEARRRPGHGRVTSRAVRRCHDVVGRLAGRRRAVVAGEAGARDLRVIDACSRLPHRDDVAGLAARGRRNVSSVLARGAGAVMATHAVACNAAVIEPRGLPGRRAMAVVALG